MEPDKAFPFVKQLEAKQSTFTLQVPTQFCFNDDAPLSGGSNNNQPISHRKLFFSELRIVPDFFSQHATKLNIDSEEELNMPMDQTIQIAYSWNEFMEKEELNARPTITLNQNEFDTSHLIKAFNAIAEQKKGSGQKYAPCFCDWIKEYDSIDEATEDPWYEKFLDNIPNQAEELYGAPYDAAVHGVSLLETSMKSFPRVNKYALPDLSGEDNNVRVRFNLQPGVTIAFSNATFFNMIGFIASQVQVVNRQFIISNRSKTEWKKVTGYNRPMQIHDPEAKASFKVSISYMYNGTTCLSDPYTLALTKRQFLDDGYFYRHIGPLFNKIGHDLNLNLSFTFSTKTITFPNDSKLALFQINLSPTLADRLLYGKIDSIQASTPNIVPSTDTTHYDVQAKTLVYDTGLIFITHKNTSSNILTQYSEEFVASLEPQVDGIMKLVPNYTSQLANFFYAPNYFSGTSVVDLVFNLYTVYPNSDPVLLNWITGAYVFGNLRSRL